MVATQGQTPPAIIAKLNAEIRGIVSDPDIETRLLREGAIPQVTPGPDELKEFVRTEIVRWGKIVQDAGIAGTE
jgi:tripartite-type tricarboxylate transporter receptor subunit TctC